MRTKEEQQMSLIRYFARNMGIIIGVVLIWRGIWHILDRVDFFVFGGNTLWTAILGIALGLALLYLPDKDLKELEKL